MPLSIKKLSSVLLARGRLSLGQIIRFSELKPRTARACILILIQHNILWHTKGSDDMEMFEVNIDECLMRIRFGRFIWLAEELFGKMVRRRCNSKSSILTSMIGGWYRSSYPWPWKTATPRYSFPFGNIWLKEYVAPLHVSAFPNASSRNLSI